MRRPKQAKLVTMRALVVCVSVFIVRQCYATINPGCECVTFQGSDQKLSGEFTSPNYPSTYRANINCLLYIFVAPPGRRMIVEILFMDLDLGEVNQYGNCNTGDKLKVYLWQPTPSINASVRADMQVCGGLRQMTRRTFYSRGRVLMLELETDGYNATHRGFKGTFNFINAAEFITNGNERKGTQCTYDISAGAHKEGRIFSPDYPHNYPPDSVCEYKFFGDWHEQVQIIFVKIDLATQGVRHYSYSSDNIIQNHNNPNRTCDVTEKGNDIITVYDGDNTETPVIGQYCGYHNHQEVISTGKRMMVKFTSRRKYTLQGFAALFKFVTQKSEPERCEMVINSTYLKKSVITSELYPQPYPSGATCVYKFNAGPKERIAIRFIEFDLGAITDGRASCSLRDKMVIRIRANNTYLSNLKTFCGSTLPPPIMSNGPYIQLEFKGISQNSRAKGFKFEYRFTTDFGIKADEVASYAPCVNKYRRSKNVEGVIVSPNYPGLYPKATICSYYFYGEGRKIMINFTHFDVSGQPPGCLEETNSDYVSLSNFPMAKDKKMGRYCSNNYAPDYVTRQTIISDAGFYRIVFKSGMLGSGTGFRAVYKFIEPEESTASDQQIGSANSIHISNSIIYMLSLVYYPISWMVTLRAYA